MALIWIDGFDAYGTDNQDVGATMNSSGWIVGGTGHAKTSATTESGIGYSLTITFGELATLPFGNSPGICCGFRAYSTGASGQVVCFTQNNLIGTVTTQFRLWLNGQNGLSVGTQDGDLIASTPVNSFLPNVWYYVEINYVPSKTTGGTIQVKVDGIEMINVTSTKTCASTCSAEIVNQIQFGTETNGITHQVIGGMSGYWDDFYLEIRPASRSTRSWETWWCTQCSLQETKAPTP